MNNSMLAHLWAQQTKNNGKGSHFFFEGPTIYSYGHHFPIATFLTNDVVLVTTRQYSVSTAGHIAKVRQAIPSSVTAFHVDDVQAQDRAGHFHNFTMMREHIEKQRQCLGRCRMAGTRVRVSESIRQAVAQANAYAKHFRLGRTIKEQPHESLS